MRALYEVYQEKAKDEIVGYVWLTPGNVEQIRRNGSLQMFHDEPLALPPSREEIPDSMTVNVIRFWLGGTRDGVYRLYTNGTSKQIADLQKAQEDYFRFPVPISVLPG